MNKPDTMIKVFSMNILSIFFMEESEKAIEVRYVSFVSDTIFFC